MDQADTRILNRAGERVRGALFVAVAVRLIAGCASAAADEPVEPLQHMGVVCLQEEPLASEFAGRLVAHGKPVFYIGDIVKGVSQGDIIRFKDKAVLIDGNVWQTMMSMGILNRLKDIPVLTLTAKAKSAVWNARSDQVTFTNENKGYLLGRELLKIIEDYFGSTPSSMELVIRFHGDYLTLIAPYQLMSELRFAKVMHQQKSAGPAGVRHGTAAATSFYRAAVFVDALGGRCPGAFGDAAVRLRVGAADRVQLGRCEPYDTGNSFCIRHLADPVHGQKRQGPDSRSCLHAFGSEQHSAPGTRQVRRHCLRRHPLGVCAFHRGCGAAAR